MWLKLIGHLSFWRFFFWMFQKTLQYWACWIRANTFVGNAFLGLWGEGRWFFGFVASCSSTFAMEFRQTGGEFQKWDHNFAMKFGDYKQIYNIESYCTWRPVEATSIWCWFRNDGISLFFVEGHGKTTELNCRNQDEKMSSVKTYK